MSNVMETDKLKVAQWWEPVENGKILCTLCPATVRLVKGKPGSVL